MTNTKQKNIQINPNTTPSNAGKTKQSRFKNLINQALENDKAKGIQQTNASNIGNDFVKYYKGLNIAKFNAKYQSDAIKDNIAIRVKGHKNSDTAKPITGSASVIISTIKKYINTVDTISDKITYTEIRKAVAPKSPISPERKEFNKTLASMTDAQIKALLLLAKTNKTNKTNK